MIVKVLCHILTIVFVQDLYVMQQLLCVISHHLCAVLSGLHNCDKQASGKWLLMVSDTMTTVAALLTQWSGALGSF